MTKITASSIIVPGHTGVIMQPTLTGIYVVWSELPGYTTEVYINNNSAGFASANLDGVTSGSSYYLDGFVPGNYTIYLQRRSNAGFYSTLYTSATQSILGVTPSLISANVPIYNGGGYSHRYYSSEGEGDFNGIYNSLAGTGEFDFDAPTTQTLTLSSYDTWIDILTVENLSVPDKVNFNFEFESYEDWDGFTITDLMEVNARIIWLNGTTIENVYDFRLFSSDGTFTTMANPNLSMTLNNKSDSNYSHFVADTGNTYAWKYQLQKTRAVGTDVMSVYHRSHNLRFNFTEFVA
tara:strand:+ start:3996 stop:4874 length:879 start_codon:yes stop_codon:yes gene_type:complete